MGYVLRRVVAVVPIWWVVASIVFVLVRLVPGDPVLLIAGTDASAEQVRDIRSSLGLDLPVYEQYVRWFGRLLHGDMGRSLFPREPVARDLLDDGRVFLQTAPWMILFPAGALALTILGMSLLGDGLRDALDPKLRSH